MKIQRAPSTAVAVFRVACFDATTGAAKTGLTYATDGLSITINSTGGVSTAKSGANIEAANATTPANPTSGKYGFVEVGGGEYLVTANYSDAGSNVAGLATVALTDTAGDAFSVGSIETNSQPAVDDAGNKCTDLQTVKTQGVTCAAAITLGAYVGNATHALVVDDSGYVTYANNAPPSAATISTQVNADLTTAHGTGSYVMVTTGLGITANQAVNAAQWGGASLPTAFGVSGTVTVGGYTTGQDPATWLLVTPANKLATGATGKAAATIATGDFADIPAVRAAKIDNLDAAISTRGTSTLAAGAKMDFADSLNATGVASLKSQLGTIDSQVKGIDTDAITAASVKADAVLKIQAGTVTTTRLNEVEQNLLAGDAFDAIWRKALTGIVKICWFDDSQNTTGNGRPTYLGHFNNEFARRFGGCPATPIFTTCGNVVAWLVSTAAVTTSHPSAVTAGRIAANQVPPAYFAPQALAALTGEGGTEDYGSLSTLAPDNIQRGFGDPQLSGGDYFDVTGGVDFEVIAATYSSSAEIKWRYRPNTTAINNFFATATATGTTAMGLESGTFSIKTETITCTYDVAHPYPQMELSSGTAGKSATLMAFRWYSNAHPNGVVVDSWSNGGYRASYVIANHDDCWTFLASQNYDAAVLHFGANDGGYITAAQYKINLLALIARIRSQLGAAMPIFLFTDMWTNEGANQAEADQFPETCREIARTDQYTRFIDSATVLRDAWKKTEDTSAFVDKGAWNSGTTYAINDMVSQVEGSATNYYACIYATTNNQPPSYLYWTPVRLRTTDGVHYSPAGAAELARYEVSAMLSSRVPAEIATADKQDTAKTVIDAIKAKTDTIPASGIATEAKQDAAQDILAKLDGMLVLSGAACRFTAAALALAPSGSGSTTINLLPLVTTVATNEYITAGGSVLNFTLAQHSKNTWIFSVVIKATGAAVDLLGEILSFVRHEVGSETVLDRTTVTASGTNGNQVTVNVDPPKTDERKRWDYKLWNETDRILLASGTVSVAVAPV